MRKLHTSPDCQTLGMSKISKCAGLCPKVPCYSPRGVVEAFVVLAILPIFTAQHQSLCPATHVKCNYKSMADIFYIVFLC